MRPSLKQLLENEDECRYPIMGADILGKLALSSAPGKVKLFKGAGKRGG